MKSRLFGRSAKLALAILAVCGGLLTSCYEKGDEMLAPKYVIAGTITNSLTGDAITNATVTIAGTAVPTNGNKFEKEVPYTASAISVVVSAPDYETKTESVTLTKVEYGIFRKDLDIKLVLTDPHHGGGAGGN